MVTSDSSDEDDEQAIQYDEVPASMDGSEAHGGYNRGMPDRFVAERDDRLMNSMVGAYSREVFNDGAPTGHLFLNKVDARNAANEVIANHKNEDRQTDYEGDRFEDTWNHFDVNKDGLVEVERMPQFMRMLLGNALAIDLQ